MADLATETDARQAKPTMAAGSTVTDAVVAELLRLSSNTLPKAARDAGRRKFLSHMQAMRTGAGSAALDVAARVGRTDSPLDIVLKLGISVAEGLGPGPLGNSSRLGICVTPAVLFAAASRDLTGERLVDAVTLAYELELRIDAALFGSFSRSGWDVSCVAGVVAAAAGACLAGGATRGALHNAMGIAGAQVLGRRASAGTMLHAFSAGRGAANGYHAYMLARDGFTGPLGIFDAARGYLHVLSPNADASLLTDGLGERWRIVDTEADDCVSQDELLDASTLLETVTSSK